MTAPIRRRYRLSNGLDLVGRTSRRLLSLWVARQLPRSPPRSLRSRPCRGSVGCASGCPVFSPPLRAPRGGGKTARRGFALRSDCRLVEVLSLLRSDWFARPMVVFVRRSFRLAPMVTRFESCARSESEASEPCGDSPAGCRRQRGDSPAGCRPAFDFGQMLRELPEINDFSSDLPLVSLFLFSGRSNSTKSLIYGQFYYFVFCFDFLVYLLIECFAHLCMTNRDNDNIKPEQIPSAQSSNLCDGGGVLAFLDDRLSKALILLRKKDLELFSCVSLLVSSGSRITEILNLSINDCTYKGRIYVRSLKGGVNRVVDGSCISEYIDLRRGSNGLLFPSLNRYVVYRYLRSINYVHKFDGCKRSSVCHLPRHLMAMDVSLLDNKGDAVTVALGHKSSSNDVFYEKQR